MPGLLDTNPKPDTNPAQRLLLIGLLLAAALAAAAFAFYHHENHAPAEATSLRTLTLPLHTVFTRQKDAIGADQTDDTLYVVTAVRLQDRGDAPLFLKDITATLTTTGGAQIPVTVIGADKRDRLLTVVPTLAPVLKQIALPPLEAEQKIPPHSTAEGYVLLQLSAPESAWQQRAAATLRLDFYHQDSLTLTLPK